MARKAKIIRDPEQVGRNSATRDRRYYHNCNKSCNQERLQHLVAQLESYSPAEKRLYRKGYKAAYAPAPVEPKMVHVATQTEAPVIEPAPILTPAAMIAAVPPEVLAESFLGPVNQALTWVFSEQRTHDRAHAFDDMGGDVNESLGLGLENWPSNLRLY